MPRERIVQVRFLKNTSVELKLSSGETVYKDLAPLLQGAQFKRLLRSTRLFATVSLHNEKLRWRDGTALPCSEVEACIAPRSKEALESLVMDHELTTLEAEVARKNLDYFLPQFTFPFNKFELEKGRPLELADHLVLIKENGIIFQIKQRNENGNSNLSKWINNKIEKTAKKHILDSMRMLKEYGEIPVTSSTGRRVLLNTAKITNLHKVICYQLPPDESAESPPRFVNSTTAGFIHVLSLQEYNAILEYLVTFSEVFDYLRFREDHILYWLQESSIASEEALIAQYVVGDVNSRSSESYRNMLQRFRSERNSFDVSFFLKDFERDSELWTPRAAQENAEILAELACLNRLNMKAARERILKAIEYCHVGKNYFRCWRFRVPSDGPCVLFVGFGPSAPDNVDKMFLNLATACKYECKVYRQVAIGVWREGATVNFRWCLIEGEVTRDEVIEEKLAEINPFPSMQPKHIPLYTFD